jgi:exosortase family protein XrtF
MSNKEFSIKEFKPAIFFVVKFLALYLIGNLLYGFFITAYEPVADPVTEWVTHQTAAILNLFDAPVVSYAKSDKPTVIIKHIKPVLGVFEGCNGVNVMIVFLSFVLAFGPMNKKLAWFLPAGLLLIHISNLFRISLLFFVSIDYPQQLYFFHKYFLTAFMYGVVFALWFFWLRINKRHAIESK